MHVRHIALAVPLVVLGMACMSSRSQSDRGGTATSSSAEPSGQGGARDPMAVPGPSIKGHAEDQIVSGTISEVSAQSVSIQSTLGETKRLDIEPETSVMVDGLDASHAQLQEGQPVRASFSEVEGRQIAVEIRAGDPSLDRPTAAGETSSPSAGTGSSSDVQPQPGAPAPGATVPRQPESSGSATPAYPPSR
jgi:hypothetical protein